jgi:hypothetical protein
MSWFFKKDKTESVKPEDVSKVKDPITSIPTLVSGIGTSVPSSEYQEKVKGWLVEANEKGLDYFEFSTAIDSLSGQALTEQQKFSVTFATFAASGVTPTALVESAERYLQMVNNKSAQFHLELSRAIEKNVTNRQDSIKQAEQEIAALSKQIEEKAKFIQATNVEMNNAQADLSIKESSFNSTILQATEKIKSDIEKNQNTS